MTRQARPGWAAGRVVVPGTAAQLGALGLFPPAGDSVRVATDDGELAALAADPALLWLTFSEVVRAAAAGIGWAGLVGRHALWVVSGVPPLRTATSDEAAAFLGLAEVLHAADMPLIVVAPSDPGPMRRPLPVDLIHADTSDDALPPPAQGS